MIASRTSGFGVLLFAAAAALPLAACGGQEETTYEADATDVSGGELIVTEATSPGVPVDVPDTPMTNVPPETPEAGQASPTP
ncbi:hypothetical protein ABVV53_16655 [Novosphingobium sp. RD2P27]|uniref:Argininosuccinate lyase n=1 Tax=Novosphingobium kalidii TaxID=3230299 RepID=A0ABV2D5C4_9SPHN